MAGKSSSNVQRPGRVIRFSWPTAAWRVIVSSIGSESFLGVGSTGVDGDDGWEISDDPLADDGQ